MLRRKIACGALGAYISMVDLQRYKDSVVHFIGIGGCSMSGLAVILKNLGYRPQGSDINESVFTKKLEQERIPFSIGHKAQNIGDAKLVVYSAAIKPGNPEYDRAVDLGLPMLTRAELLGQISRHRDWSYSTCQRALRPWAQRNACWRIYPPYRRSLPGVSEMGRTAAARYP